MVGPCPPGCCLFMPSQGDACPVDALAHSAERATFGHQLNRNPQVIVC